ncbi:HBS1-like protein [Kappamyces sp. JEL0680]|nr:HBS1-like protein [Kappamyces sp. JEL0680]
MGTEKKYPSLGSLAQPTISLSDLLNKNTASAGPIAANSRATASPLNLSQLLSGKSLLPTALAGSSSQKPTAPTPDRLSVEQRLAPAPAIAPSSLSGTAPLHQSLEAPPSSFGQFMQHSASPSRFSALSTILTPSVEEQEPYHFEDPSPDDIVLTSRAAPKGKAQARSSQSGKKKEIPAKPQKQASKKHPKSGSDAAHSAVSLNQVSSSLEGLAVVTPKKAAKQNNKRVNVAEEFEKRQGTEERLNLVVVGVSRARLSAGHVDAGKSTLMGHLLLDLGEVNQRTIAKFKKEAETMKKGSFLYAWVLDATEDERARGVTIDVGVSQFKTPKRTFTLLDAPGHRDFVPNMISGTSQADVAVLVVDASTGGFESGFEAGGQTREHALLLKSLGIEQLAVAVNKMDTIGWAKDRFDDIQEKLSTYLASIGFSAATVSFVPVSGFTGDNLSKKPKTTWYHGPTLVETLGTNNALIVDGFSSPRRSLDAPFVLSVQDYFKGGLGPGGGGSVTVAGRVESGQIQVGDDLVAMPINETGTVKAIQIGDDDSQWAVAGDRVSVSLAGLDPIQLHLGSILCDPKHKVPLSSRLRARISTFELDRPITIGVPVIMYHLGASEPAIITVLESSISKEGVEKKRPRVLGSNVEATVIIDIQRAICCEKASVSPSLGRFLLRMGAASIASGVILDASP